MLSCFAPCMWQCALLPSQGAAAAPRCKRDRALTVMVDSHHLAGTCPTQSRARFACCVRPLPTLTHSPSPATQPYVLQTLPSSHSTRPATPSPPPPLPPATLEQTEEFAKMCEGCGIAALGVHGRRALTRSLCRFDIDMPQFTDAESIQSSFSSFAVYCLSVLLRALRFSR